MGNDGIPDGNVVMQITLKLHWASGAPERVMSLQVNKILSRPTLPNWPLNSLGEFASRPN